MEITRGSIWFAEVMLPMREEGIQTGDRPVIITQNDLGNRYSPTIGVMIGSKIMKNLDQQTKVLLTKECGLRENTVFMAEQMQTIPKSKLKFYIGQVPDDKMQEVDTAIKIQNGLVKPFELSHVQALINQIYDLDIIEQYIGHSTEELTRSKICRIAELETYCNAYGYKYKILLDKYYPLNQGVAMSG